MVTPRPIRWAALLLIGTAGGCIWPAFTSPTCSLEVVQDGTPRSAEIAEGPLAHAVALSYWWNPAVNSTPPSIEGLRAFVAKPGQTPLSFGIRMYPVVWTPALGTQHVNPEPSVMVFVENALPSVAIPGMDQRRLCCGPPPTKPYVLRTNLQAPVASPGDQPAIGYMLEQHLVALSKQIDALDHALAQLSDDDRRMVCRDLRQAVTSCRSPDTTNRENLQRMASILSRYLDRPTTAR